MVLTPCSGQKGMARGSFAFINDTFSAVDSADNSTGQAYNTAAEPCLLEVALLVAATAGNAARNEPENVDTDCRSGCARARFP